MVDTGEDVPQPNTPSMNLLHPEKRGLIEGIAWLWQQRRARRANERLPGWFCGHVGCPWVGPHEHASGAQSGRNEQA